MYVTPSHQFRMTRADDVARRGVGHWTTSAREAGIRVLMVFPELNLTSLNACLCLSDNDLATHGQEISASSN